MCVFKFEQFIIKSGYIYKLIASVSEPFMLKMLFIVGEYEYIPRDVIHAFPSCTLMTLMYQGRSRHEYIMQ